MNVEKKFITSPAQVESQRRVKLQDAYVSEEDKNNFRNLCKEYADIFSKSSRRYRAYTFGYYGHRYWRQPHLSVKDLIVYL